MHVIKQKPHHRLYDATTKRYISVQGVRCLADSGQELHVLDRAGRDVTERALPRLLDTSPKPAEPHSWAELVEAGAGAATQLVSMVIGAGVDAARWLRDRPSAAAGTVRDRLEELARELHLARSGELAELRARVRRLEAKVRRSKGRGRAPRAGRPAGA